VLSSKHDPKMRRALPFPLRTILRLLAIAVAMVVASRVAPIPNVRSAAAIVALEQGKSGDHSLRVGERVEPRVLPAPLVDRLPPLPAPGCSFGALSERGSFEQAAVVDHRSQDERDSIVKHVPRMERGDPPKA
jgi:hypothetical protein